MNRSTGPFRPTRSGPFRPGGSSSRNAGNRTRSRLSANTLAQDAFNSLADRRTQRTIGQTVRYAMNVSQSIAPTSAPALGSLARLFTQAGSLARAIGTLVNAARGGRGGRTSQRAIDDAHRSLERAGYTLETPHLPPPSYRSTGVFHNPVEDMPPIPLAEKTEATVISPKNQRRGGSYGPGTSNVGRGGPSGRSAATGRFGSRDGSGSAGGNGGSSGRSGGKGSGGGDDDRGFHVLGKPGPDGDPDRYIRVFGSSSVYAFGYDRSTRTLTVQYFNPIVKAIQVYKNRLGKKRFRGKIGAQSGSPGAVYEYFDVPERAFMRMKAADSKGEAVWDILRIRGTVWGHRFDYRLAAATTAFYEDGTAAATYVPRKAVVDGGFKQRTIQQNGKYFRSLLPSVGMPSASRGLQ
jgi:hypothetical protein